MRSLMSLGLQDVLPDDVTRFLDLDSEPHFRPPEGPFLDYKAGRIDDIGKTVAAMCNTGGGWIMLGVAEDGDKRPSKITGVERAEEDRVSNQILATVRPRPSFGLKTVPLSALVVLVRVEPGEETPYAWLKGGDDHIYVRRGAHDKLATRDEVISLVKSGASKSTGNQLGSAPFPNSPRMNPYFPVAPGAHPASGRYVAARNVVRALTWPSHAVSVGAQDADDEERFDQVVRSLVRGGAYRPTTTVWDMEEVEFDVTPVGLPTERWRLARRMEVGLGITMESAEGLWDLERCIARTAILARVATEWDARNGQTGPRMFAIDISTYTLAIHPDSAHALKPIDLRPLEERFRVLSTGAATNSRFGARVPPNARHDDWINALTDAWLPALRQRAWYAGTRDRLAHFIAQHAKSDPAAA